MRFPRAAVLPTPVSFLVHLALLPAVFAGLLGAPLGLTALFLAALQHWKKLDSCGWLAARDLLGHAYILCGFLLGFVARLRTTAPPREQGDEGRLLSSLALLGLVCLPLVWFPCVSALTTGWAVLCAGLGSWAASLYARSTLERPEVRPRQTEGESR